MPSLQDHRKTKELSLPGYPDSKVVIYCGLLFGDALGVNQQDQEKYILTVLPKFIKEWNFVDDKSNPMPINQESLKLLNLSDVEFLTVSIKELIESEKKSVEPKPQSV